MVPLPSVPGSIKNKRNSPHCGDRVDLYCRNMLKTYRHSIIVSLLIAGCATSPSLDDAAAKFRYPQFNYPKTTAEEVRLLRERPVDQKYNIIGNIFVTSNSDWPAFEEGFKKIAAEIGADSVIIYSRGELYDAVSSGNPCQVLRYRKKKCLLGKAIKYIEEGEVPKFRNKGISVAQWDAAKELIKKLIRLQIDKQTIKDPKWREELTKQIAELNQPLRDQGVFTLGDDDMAQLRMLAFNDVWPNLKEIHEECNEKLWAEVLYEYLRAPTYRVRQ